MFHRKLGENTAFGRPTATEAEIRGRRRARPRVRRRLPRVSAGSSASAGWSSRAQRLAIARAILRDAPILLLDETTSVLDAESVQIQAALWRMMAGRTFVVVAHQLSPVAGIDRLVVLEHGRVVDQGSHTELRALGRALRGAVEQTVAQAALSFFCGCCDTSGVHPVVGRAEENPLDPRCHHEHVFELPAPGGSSGTGPLEPLPPGLDDRFLAVLSSGTRYFPNSVIPLVSAVYATRPTGLMVPERLARPPQPIDSVKTYLRGLDVLGEEISALTTVHHLRRLPLRDALAFCADLLRIFDDPRAGVHDLDDHLRPRFTAAGWRRVRSLIADGSRMLVAPQVLLTMMKCAALSSGDMLLPSASPGDPLVALLGSADDLGRREDADDRSGGDVVDAGMPGFLAQAVVAAHHFHRQLDVHHMVGRFFQCWREYPAQLAGQQRIVDLPGEFRSAVGVRLDDFVAVGAILYLAAIAGHVTVPRHVLIDLALEEAGTA
ncbi:hypothetical protein [Pseudonocardia ailaonensis]